MRLTPDKEITIPVHQDTRENKIPKNICIWVLLVWVYMYTLFSLSCLGLALAVAVAVALIKDMGQSFHFDNPMAQSKCGCGTSFNSKALNTTVRKSITKPEEFCAFSTTYLGGER